MIRCTTIETEGNRCIRLGTYQVDAGDGEPPELRAFLSAGWLSTPLLPFASETVDVPASALPALRAALEALEAER